ncbi:hypothetical protein [Parabacteroides distasonis]|uniref:hypothetical protein n=1 Tax=Parabacteroides distasonis TaxID=823 RepID=UPI001D117EE5|nr:hypothetical protein [Parabacteroides distasonis]MCC2200922.1 hypothetical protein [Parabacteroides distasonis]MCS2856685.1 hypothetical protein [Parabacteroides distasonis]
MNRGKNKSRNTAGETAEPTMTGQKPPFLLFLSPAQNGTRSVQEVADGRVEWHGAIALSCEICRGITAFGRYYHDALATPRKIVVPAARRLAPSPFLDTVSLQFQGHQLYETRRYFQSGIRAGKARYKA